MYPLKFKPIFKSVIWGGNKICRFKQINDYRSTIGESWEISGMSGNASIVTNGYLKGKSLASLVRAYGERLVGKKVYEKYGKNFPLLVKFIDACEPLSVQVHPDDDLAQKRHRSFGKTEMWYVVDAEKDACIYSGFSQPLTPEQFIQSLEDNTLIDYLNCYKVTPGDVFFLPAGRVHAIGKGCFIAEIQQASNITYRVFDYNRIGKRGIKRELHIDQAKEAIDYNQTDSFVSHASKEVKRQNLIESPYFSVEQLRLKNEKYLLQNQTGTFIICMCLKGNGKITDPSDNILRFEQGETILIPAENEYVYIESYGGQLLLIHP